MNGSGGPAWRVFPWNPEAEEGAPFSASFVPAGQGDGRFDLPGSPRGVIYLSETADHAIGEKIQHLRNTSLGDYDLLESGHRRALVEVTIDDAVRTGMVDLCDPRELVRLGIRPDDTAMLNRTLTQDVSSRIHAAGHTGFRWWSAFFGEWHTLVLFRDRLASPLTYGPPAHLQTDSPSLRDAMRLLAIALEAE